jgi:hypothetical protein
MMRASFTSILTVVLLGVICPVVRAAPDEPPDTGKKAGGADEHGRVVPAAPPENAEAALGQAAAAYEYGDMNQVVDGARPVTEGLLPATPHQQARAFRLLGIGLYLTNRQPGAETAFKELLRLEPSARLDPTTTRPEVVAFLDNLRRQQVVDRRWFPWNFLPPVGQFQNQDNAKGWLILSVGVISFGSLATSYFLPKSWKAEGDTYGGHEDAVHALKIVNFVSAGLLAATYLYGVIDGCIGYGRPLDESKTKVSLRLLPQGAGIGFAF